jgi:hypothetical protein
MRELIESDFFVNTLIANVDNEKLDDAGFREMFRNTYPIVRIHPRCYQKGDLVRYRGIIFEFERLGKVTGRAIIKELDTDNTLAVKCEDINRIYKPKKIEPQVDEDIKSESMFEDQGELIGYNGEETV